MKLQRSSTDPIVAPAQVWAGLTAETRAAAIQFLARLASNLVTRHYDSTHPEISPCRHRSVPPRSAPSISTAKP
jgi:hypothetical protein